MRRVRHRRAARVVISEHGGEPVDRRRPHAVELREIAVGVTEEAQHRHHAVDGVVERRRRRQAARGKQLPQRQQVHQQVDQRAGVAADMAAVRQDLLAQLVDQPPPIRGQVTGLTLHAQRGVVERDHRLQPRQPVARLVERAAQIAHLPRQAADEAAVEFCIGVLQQERRLAEPADDAARQNIEPPAGGVPAALQTDPVFDQRTRIGAGDGRIGGAQMAQPGKIQQDDRPFVGRRRHFKGRSAVADHDLAGEGETPGIDFAGAGGVGGAQILRRDHQPVGLAGAELPAQQRVRVDAADQTAECAASDKHGEL